jgi:hypothetical protein
MELPVNISSIAFRIPTIQGKNWLSGGEIFLTTGYPIFALSATYTKSQD